MDCSARLRAAYGLRGANLLYSMLLAVAFSSAQSHTGTGKPSEPGRTWAKFQRLERTIRAASVHALLQQYKSSGYVYTSRSLECSSRKFLWALIDTGSGGYIIHGLLYEIEGGKPRLVLHILPEYSRTNIAVRAEKNVIIVSAWTQQKPRERVDVARYYVNKEG
jgi:hypothetical protein